MSRTRCCYGKIKTNVIVYHCISLNISCCSFIKQCIFDQTYIIYIYIYIYIYIFIYIYTCIYTYIWYLKNHYVTFNHCTSLPHIIFCIMFLYLYKYFILLLCIITFNIDYCYVLLHTQSHVWPEFNKLLSIVYCLLQAKHFTSEITLYFVFV